MSLLTALPRCRPAALASLVLLFVPLTSYAQEAIDCTTALEAAEAQYFAAQFDAAIGLIETCLERRAFDRGQQEKAYTLLGQSYFAKRQEDQARAAVRALLDLLPNYEPGPELRPSFRQLVEEIKASLQEDPVVQQEAEEAEAAPRRSRRWLWLGGGAVLTGAAVTALVALSGGGGGGDPAGFPAPPGRPN